ncbi:unnamed protein product, partial [Phaeothamnion confervicola]
LNQVERAVGAQLLRRTTRRLELTEVGQRLYTHGQRIRDELMEARDAAQTLGTSLHGRVRISVPTGFGQVVMAPWFLEFRKLHPGVGLQVHFDNRVDDLLRHEVDLAIRLIEDPPLGLVAREIGRASYVACASAQYERDFGLPKSLEELAARELISTSTGGKITLTAVRGEARHEVTVEPSLTSENFLFLRDAVLAGVGMGVLPGYLVESELAAGQVVRALSEWQLVIYGTRMYLLRRQDRFPTLALRTLMDFIIAKAAEREV